MPAVKPGESRDSYVPRCIAFVMGKEGLDQKAAAGKCEGMYDQHAKTLKSIEGLSTGDVPEHATCQCSDKAACNCKTKVRKTMTPEEEAAAKKKKPEEGSGNAPPPPTEKTAPPPPGGDANGDTPGETPPGTGQGASSEAPSVQVAKAVYTSLKNLQGNLAAAENTYENPEAKSYFNGPFKQKCDETMGEIKGLISKLGSNTGDDTGDQSGGDQTADDGADDEEAMKSFLALGNTNDLKLLGYVAPLNALHKAKNLTPEQKLCLGGVLKSIRGLCDEAKANSEEAKRKTMAAHVYTLQESQAGISKSIADFQKSMNQLLGKS